MALEIVKPEPEKEEISAELSVLEASPIEQQLIELEKRIVELERCKHETQHNLSLGPDAVNAIADEVLRKLGAQVVESKPQKGKKKKGR